MSAPAREQCPTLMEMAHLDGDGCQLVWLHENSGKGARALAVYRPLQGSSGSPPYTGSRVSAEEVLGIRVKEVEGSCYSITLGLIPT